MKFDDIIEKINAFLSSFSLEKITSFFDSENTKEVVSTPLHLANRVYAKSRELYTDDVDQDSWLDSILSIDFSTMWQIFILLCAIFFIYRIFFKNKNRLLQKRNRRFWKEIYYLSKASDQISMQMAIIKADQFLDASTKQLDIPGETFSDRIKNATSTYSSLENIREAHAVRNKLVHEANTKLKKEDVKKYIQQYETCLKQMKVL